MVFGVLDSETPLLGSNRIALDWDRLGNKVLFSSLYDEDLGEISIFGRIIFPCFCLDTWHGGLGMLWKICIIQYNFLGGENEDGIFVLESTFLFGSVSEKFLLGIVNATMKTGLAILPHFRRPNPIQQETYRSQP